MVQHIDPVAESPAAYWPWLVLLALMAFVLASVARRAPAHTALAALVFYATNPAAQSAKRPAVAGVELRFVDTPLLIAGAAWPPRCARTALGVQCQPTHVVLGALGRWHTLDLQRAGATIERATRNAAGVLAPLVRAARRVVLVPLKSIVTPPAPAQKQQQQRQRDEQQQQKSNEQQQRNEQKENKPKEKPETKGRAGMKSEL